MLLPCLRCCRVLCVRHGLAPPTPVQSLRFGFNPGPCALCQGQSEAAQCPCLQGEETLAWCEFAGVAATVDVMGLTSMQAAPDGNPTWRKPIESRVSPVLQWGRRSTSRRCPGMLPFIRFRGRESSLHPGVPGLRGRSVARGGGRGQLSRMGVENRTEMGIHVTLIQEIQARYTISVECDEHHRQG
jgi:hypothetical protein